MITRNMAAFMAKFEKEMKSENSIENAIEIMCSNDYFDY